jgi:hypothetical protein
MTPGGVRGGERAERTGVILGKHRDTSSLSKSG